MKKINLSIFHRLLISFLGVVFIASATLTTVFYVFSNSSNKKNTEENITQQFNAIRSHFNSKYKDDLIRQQKILASNPIIDEFMMASSKESEILARSVERLFLQSISYTGTYESIAFVDYSGKAKIIVNRDGRNHDYAGFAEDDFFNTIASKSPGTLSIKGPIKNNNKTSFLIGIGKVDPDIGEFGGAIITKISFNEFLSYLNEKTFFGKNPIWVFTTKKELIKKPSMEAIFDPRPQMGNEMDKQSKVTSSDKGILIYSDLSILTGSPFIRLAISVPQKLLQEDIRFVLNFFLFVFFIALILTSVVVSYLSRNLAQPVIKIAQATVDFTKGDRSQRVEVKTTGELKTLVDSFNQMAEDLEKTTVTKDYLDNIINSMLGTLVVISPEKRILQCNTSTLALLGYEYQELLNQPFSIVSPEKNMVGKENERGVIEPVLAIEKAYVAKNGTSIPVIFSSSPLYNTSGTLQGIVCAAYDITDRKQAEKELERLNKQIVMVAREAGKAELATDVLHNVGNVLNSVNVAAEVIKESVRKSPALTIVKAAQMIQQHENDLGHFFTNHPKGKKLPEYFNQISEQIKNENAKLATTIKNLLLKLEHIKMIVNMQQSYAKMSDLNETISLKEIIDDAVTVNEDSFSRHHIMIEKKMSEVPSLFNDRHKILQILINLLNNSKHSVISSPKEEKIISIVLEKADEKNIKIEIFDNGVGIVSKNLKSIFNYGFTTRTNGHGFGLHSSANAAMQLGGKLHGTSDGYEKGAIFTLELPLKREKKEPLLPKAVEMKGNYDPSIN